MFVKRGTIDGFQGSWGSGLGYLIVSGEAVPCDNGPTVRALNAAFGGEEGTVITDAHRVDNENGPHVGEEIVWWMDDFGGMTLGGFMPAHYWDTDSLPEVPKDGLEWDPGGTTD